MLGVFYLIPFSPLISFIMLIITPLTLVGLHGFIKVKTLLHGKNSPDSIVSLYKPRVMNIHVSKEYDSFSKKYKSFCTYHANESIEWKKKLVENAKYNVVLSGSYCGGKIFDEFLSIIERKLKNNPNFKTYLISSEIWFTPSNFKKIKELTKNYPDQFIGTVTKEKNLSISPEKGKIQVTCNHIKALVIDYGRYFVVGGSGVEDRYTNYTGEESIPNRNFPFYKKLSQDAVAPIAFKDCDFVFSSKEKHGVGKQLYIDLITLITKWQTTKTHDHFAMEDLLSPFDYDVNEEYIPEIDNHKEAVSSLKIQANISGPDAEKHMFYEKLINGIENAKKSIVIDHLYFHPSKRLLNALIEASNKGVNITLITNSDRKNSPGLNQMFVALSRSKYKKLFEGKNKSNISIFEFACDNVTLHKKIVVIDEKDIYTGSSNIGYNSMTSSADYELDLIISSEELARNALNKISIDQMKCSEKIPYEKIQKINLKSALLAPLQANIEFLL